MHLIIPAWSYDIEGTLENLKVIREFLQLLIAGKSEAFDLDQRIWRIVDYQNVKIFLNRISLGLFFLFFIQSRLLQN